MIDYKSYSEKTLALTEKIMDRNFTRYTGTESAHDAAQHIGDEMEEIMDEVSLEEFAVYPAALLSFFKVIALFYPIMIISSLIWEETQNYWTIMLWAIAIFIFSQFVFYLGLFDKLHKKKKGINVIGTLEPKNEVKQQIIISGHLDSPQVFGFIESEKWQHLYGIRIFAGLVPPILSVIFFTRWTILDLHYNIEPVEKTVMLIIFAISIIIVAPFWRFTHKEISPGAGDNLNSCSMAIMATKIVKENTPLEHTRIICISFDSEEVGLIGAKRYAKKHKEELLALPTININMDAIYHKDELGLLKADINGFTNLSKETAQDISDMAKKLGLEIPIIRIPFGGGGTDATQLARIGVPSTTLYGMDDHIVRRDLFYHTSRDTIDRIDLDAVTFILELLHKYLQAKDTQIQ